jgi:hypothetical protein
MKSYILILGLVVVAVCLALMTEGVDAQTSLYSPVTSDTTDTTDTSNSSEQSTIPMFESSANCLRNGNLMSVAMVALFGAFAHMFIL